MGYFTITDDSPVKEEPSWFKRNLTNIKIGAAMVLFLVLCGGLLTVFFKYVV
jgi:hypothetical protein